jgi:hypothetical protein
MSEFCVADLANSRAIRKISALNSNILNLTAMDGGNAKGLQEQPSPSSFHPQINQRFLRLTGVAWAPFF